MFFPLQQQEENKRILLIQGGIPPDQVSEYIQREKRPQFAPPQQEPIYKEQPEEPLYRQDRQYIENPGGVCLHCMHVTHNMPIECRPNSCVL